MGFNCDPKRLFRLQIYFLSTYVHKYIIMYKAVSSAKTLESSHQHYGWGAGLKQLLLPLQTKCITSSQNAVLYITDVEEGINTFPV